MIYSGRNHRSLNVTIQLAIRLTIGLATKWLRILSLGGIDKSRNHLVANPIFDYMILPESTFVYLYRQMLFKKLQM